MNLTSVTLHDCSNMLLHATLQDFGRDEIALFVMTEPTRTLRMPYEAMAYDLHIVLYTELYKLVSVSEIIHILLGVDLSRLHTVLGYNTVEIISSELACSLRIYIADTQRHTCKIFSFSSRCK